MCNDGEFSISNIRETLQIEFRLFSNHQARRKKRCVIFAMATIREILKNKKIIPTSSKRQAKRKKARCHDDEFAKATICEFLEK